MRLEESEMRSQRRVQQSLTKSDPAPNHPSAGWDWKTLPKPWPMALIRSQPLRKSSRPPSQHLTCDPVTVPYANLG